MKPLPFPTCTWVTESLLVGGIEGYTMELPAATVEGLCAAGVSCIINLLSKEQFRAAGPEALWGGLATSSTQATTQKKTKIVATYCFWPEGDDVLPTARQVRLTLDEIDEAHAFKQIVFLNGAGNPARAVIAAGCWLARHASSPDDTESARLGWLERAIGSRGRTAAAWTLNEDATAFVCAWPSGRHAEPVLTTTELLDEEEVYPTATVEHWLSVLPTVRVYPEGRAGRSFEVPVKDEKRVGNGSIKLELHDLHSGTWIRRAYFAPAGRHRGCLHFAVQEVEQ